MAYLSDYVLDNGLNAITDATRLDICSSEPSTYAEATGTYSVANKVPPVITGPIDASPSGRKVTISAITDGSITSDGSASYWALTDTVSSRLLAANTLSSTFSVTNGNQFSLDAFDIVFPGPA